MISKNKKNQSQQKILQNTSVLITRPRAQAQELIDLFQQHGANTIYFPSIEITSKTNSQNFINHIKSLAEYTLIIFVSRSAVEHAAPTIKHYWSTLPSHTKIAAIGPATAKALQAANINVDYHPPVETSHSEGLLSLLPLEIIKNKRVLIIRGVGGREMLENTLSEHGATVDYAECYQRTLPSTDITPLCEQWEREGIDIVTSTSVESLQNLVEMLGSNARYLYNTPLVMISERMVAAAKSIGVKTVLQTDAMSAQSIVDTVCKWRKG